MASAGDYFVGYNATLSWTLGEPIIEHSAFNNYSLTQGFQQVFLQTVEIPEIPLNPSQISVYPIPVRDFLHVVISSPISSEIYLLELYDLMGKALYSKELEGPVIHEKISMSQFVSHLFLLKVTNTFIHETNIVKVLKVNQ
ncbi:MAG: hypothetical protein ISS17_00585 [Bacteroidales bacterium]|nr:hypothetical protein [Bacteroidales bacterium]